MNKELLSLSQSYKDAGLGSTWPANFLESIIKEGTPPRGRGADILETLVKRGPPTSWPTWNDAQEYIRVSETCTRPEEGKILKDLAFKLLSGNELTEKQKAFANRLVGGATRKLNVIKIDDNLREMLRGLEAKKRHMSSYYWSNRAVTSGRIDAIFFKLQNMQEADIEEIDYIKQNFRGTVALWENADGSYSPGTLCKVGSHMVADAVGWRNFEEVKSHDILIIGNLAFTTYGEVMVQCMIEGKTVDVQVKSLVLPRKKRKKKVDVV